MDADGSHRVEDLSAMFAAADSGVKESKTIVLGTRWMPGGSVVNWPRSRQLLSRAGTRYAQLILRIPLRDLTGGFRIYSTTLLRSLNLKDMTATGYCFQIEMAMASEPFQSMRVCNLIFWRMDRQLKQAGSALEMASW